MVIVSFTRCFNLTALVVTKYLLFIIKSQKKKKKITDHVFKSQINSPIEKKKLTLISCASLP